MVREYVLVLRAWVFRGGADNQQGERTAAHTSKICVTRYVLWDQLPRASTPPKDSKHHSLKFLFSIFVHGKFVKDSVVSKSWEAKRWISASGDSQECNFSER